MFWAAARHASLSVGTWVAVGGAGQDRTVQDRTGQGHMVMGTVRVKRLEVKPVAARWPGCAGRSDYTQTSSV